MRDLSPRLAIACLLVLLLLCAIWPYHEMLRWLPWGLDASKWVGNGDPRAPDWERWVFASKHFVGYRPVTALSFTINQWIAGDSAFGYRITDLALHIANVTLLFYVYRSLTGDKSVFGLLAALWVCAHPASEEIVPYPSRRSYLLAMTGGLGALLLWLQTIDTPERAFWRRAFAVAGLLLIGLLSNEVAYVFVPLLPLAALLLRGEPRLMRGLLPSLAVTLGAVAARWFVLGQLGGYQKRYFAVVVGSVPQWRELDHFAPVAITRAAIRYLLLPHGPSGQAALLKGSAAVAVEFFVGLWITWVVLSPFVAARGEPRETSREGRARALLLVWLFGSLGIVILSQTWFWRQAHAMAFPFAMLVALGLKEAFAALASRRWLSALPLPLGVVLLSASLLNSPVYNGIDPRPHLNAIVGTPLVYRIRAMMRPIPRGGQTTVWLVAPLRVNGAHILRLWGNKLGRRKGITFRLLAHSRIASLAADASLTLDRGALDGRPKLTLDKGLAFVAGPLGRAIGAGPLEIDRLWREQGDSWLFAIDANDAWASRIPAPPLGVEPLIPGEGPEIEEPALEEEP